MERFSRKEPIGIQQAVDEFIRAMKLAYGLNVQRVFAAWDEVSGAAEYTSGRYFRDGVLHITLNSSVVRSSLYMRRDELMRLINDRLAADPLFIKDDPSCRMVSKLILK